MCAVCVRERVCVCVCVCFLCVKKYSVRLLLPFIVLYYELIALADRAHQAIPRSLTLSKIRAVKKDLLTIGTELEAELSTVRTHWASG